MSLAVLQKHLKDASEEATTLADQLKHAKEKCKELQKQLDKSKEGGSDKKKEGKRKESEEAPPSGSSAKKTKPEEDAPAREKAKPRCTICKELMAGNDHTKCKKIKAEKKAMRDAEKELKLREGKEASDSESSEQ
jgi:hypothetical protein